MISPETLITMALKEGWEVQEHKGMKNHVILTRNTQKLSIYCDSMTVGKSSGGRKMVWRKDLELSDISKFLRNQRKLAITPIIERREIGVEWEKDEFWNKEHFQTPAQRLFGELSALRPQWWQGWRMRAENKRKSIELIKKYLHD